MNRKDAHQKYCRQRHNTKHRKDAAGTPIQMKMSFEEWAQVWVDSGKWDLRGRKVGQYCMCRKNDLGHYEVGNVFIATMQENSREEGITGRRLASLAITKPKKTKAQLNAETAERMRRYRLRLKAKTLQV